MDIDWSKIKSKKFEELCHIILTLNGFANIRWFGKSGGDRGRDLMAEKVEMPLPGIVKTGKWIVQCKRYVSKPPNKAVLNETITWCEAHKPDYLLFIITNVLTADTKDWLEKRSENVPFNIFCWEELDIKNELTRHPELLEYTKPSEEKELEKFAIKFVEVARESLEKFHPKILHLLPIYSKYPYGIKIVKNKKFGCVYLYFDFNKNKLEVEFSETNEDVPQHFKERYGWTTIDRDVIWQDEEIGVFFFSPPRGGYTESGASIEAQFWIENETFKEVYNQLKE